MTDTATIIPQDADAAQLSERDLTVISFALGKLAEDARRRAAVATQAATGPYGAERLLKDAAEAEDVQRKVGAMKAARAGGAE
jgi:hypothetical protein